MTARARSVERPSTTPLCGPARRNEGSSSTGRRESKSGGHHMRQKVRDVMSEDVIVCDYATSVADVARIMRDRHVGDVLVRSNGKLRGIATDRDIVVRCVAEGGEVERAPIGDLLTTDPMMVEPDASVDEAVERMVEHSIRRLPVVEDGRLVGVVSLGDLAIDGDKRSALAKISAARPNS